jgi:hypothetical protein
MAAHTLTILRQMKRVLEVLSASEPTPEARLLRVRKFVTEGLSPVGFVVTWEEWENLSKLCEFETDFEDFRSRLNVELDQLIEKYAWYDAYPCYEAVELTFGRGYFPEKPESREKIVDVYPLDRRAPVIETTIEAAT